MGSGLRSCNQIMARAGKRSVQVFNLDRIIYKRYVAVTLSGILVLKGGRESLKLFRDR